MTSSERRRERDFNRIVSILITVFLILGAGLLVEHYATVDTEWMGALIELLGGASTMGLVAIVAALWAVTMFFFLLLVTFASRELRDGDSAQADRSPEVRRGACQHSPGLKGTTNSRGSVRDHEKSNVIDAYTLRELLAEEQEGICVNCFRSESKCDCVQCDACETLMAKGRFIGHPKHMVVARGLLAIPGGGAELLCSSCFNEKFAISVREGM